MAICQNEKSFTLILFFLSFLCSCNDQKINDRKVITQQRVERASFVASSILDETKMKFLESYDSDSLYAFEETFKKNSIGVVTNLDKKTQSNVYISKGTQITNSLKDYIRRTDHIESVWAKYKSSTDISWKYTYHLKSTVLRLFPWIDLSKSFGASTEWNMLKYMQDFKSLKKIGNKFCSYPYNDVVGLGLMVSCCSVINKKNQFEDVVLTCVDFDLKSVLKQAQLLALDEGVFIQKFFITSKGEKFHYKNNLVVDFEEKRIYQNNKVDKGELLFSSETFGFKVYEIN